MSHYLGWDLVGRSERIDTQMTFENFEVGRSNRAAVDLIRSVSASASSQNGPIVLYSESGLGKTHLSHALAHDFRANGRNRLRIWDDSDWATAVTFFRKRDGIDALHDLVIRDDLLVFESVDLVGHSNQGLILRLIIDRIALGLPTLVTVTITQDSRHLGILPALKTVLNSSPCERIYRPDILLAARIARRWVAINKIAFSEADAFRAVQVLDGYFKTVQPEDASGLSAREVIFMINQLHSWCMLNGVPTTTQSIDAFLKETLPLPPNTSLDTLTKSAPLTLGPFRWL